MKIKRINITAGDCLNEILQKKYPDEIFVPFREAMVDGIYTSELFSDAFMAERAAVHHISESEYRSKLFEFLQVLDHADSYDEIALWFGDEPFCTENAKTVLQAFHNLRFGGRIVLHIVDESNGEIRRTEVQTEAAGQ